MAIWKQILLVVGTVITILLTLFVAGMIYLFSGMCGSELYQTVLSPNGKNKAVIYQFDCGATTGFSTQVSILAANEEVAANAGNILSAEGHPNDAAPELKWLSDEELDIQHRAGVKVYKQEVTWGWFWNKIQISYH